MRWLTLLISLLIESAVFWFGGPPADPTLSFVGNVALKASHPTSWVWVGWAALTLAWFFVELAQYFYTDGRRTRRLLAKDGSEELTYDTGLHWLVLLRDIYIGQSIDGDADEINQPIFVDGRRPSFTFFAVWIPIAIAFLTMLFFIGWVAWLVAAFPEQITGWSDSARAFIDSRLVGGMEFLAGPADWVVTEIPRALVSLQQFERANSLSTFFWLTVAWVVARIAGGFLKLLPLAAPIFRTIRWLIVLAAMFLVASLFGWLAPLYAYLPNGGLAAVGFIPMTFASPFITWHVALWASWRYAITRDTESHDATLYIVGGLFNSYKREFQVERVVETRINQRWWERLLGVGNLDIVQIGGAAEGTDEFKHIAGPNIFDRAIKESIRARRRRAARITD